VAVFHLAAKGIDRIPATRVCGHDIHMMEQQNRLGL
jgi:hypothetical protein